MPQKVLSESTMLVAVIGASPDPEGWLHLALMLRYESFAIGHACLLLPSAESISAVHNNL